MAGLKRKEATEISKPKAKKIKASAPAVKAPQKSSKTSKKLSKPAPPQDSDDSEDSDDSDQDKGFLGKSGKGGFQDSDSDSEDFPSDESSSEEDAGKAPIVKKAQKQSNVEGKDNKKHTGAGPDNGLNANSSKEAHAKQRALAKERKAAKPNADIIARSKKLWEQLRRKSHVPKDERQKLVTELFEIITGRVKDFVFKHDSVRVIQCALKYANQEQRKQIAQELRGEYRGLSESRYAKFLVAKLVVEGGSEVRDIIVPEFYGHVRRMVNHPEASWILDDMYRQVATPSQKAIILREWYGAEFAIFKTANTDDVTSDLSAILKETPEKRKPIMNSLFGMINQLIQKKLTGFTMLHDAMLQYFLNTVPGSEEASTFLQLITPTPAANKEQKEEADNEPEIDLLKNLAFTSSGSRVASLALAYSGAKDRKQILRAYKDTVEMLAYDPNGHLVLLTAYDVLDDTKQIATSIFSELVGKEASEAQQEKVLGLATHQVGRAAILYPFAGTAKWLLTEPQITRLEEVHKIRESTSKKQPEVRRAELVKALSSACIGTIASQAATLVQSSFGCQFITEVLMEAEGDKEPALAALAELAAGDPKEEGHIAQNPFSGRMLKNLVLGGRFDPATKSITPLSEPLGFHNVLYPQIKDFVSDWAVGNSSLVVANMLETKDFEYESELLKTLKKDKKKLKEAAEGGKESSKKKGKGGNVGAKMLLDKF